MVFFKYAPLVKTTVVRCKIVQLSFFNVARQVHPTQPCLHRKYYANSIFSKRSYGFNLAATMGFSTTNFAY